MSRHNFIISFARSLWMWRHIFVVQWRVMNGRWHVYRDRPDLFVRLMAMDARRLRRDDAMQFLNHSVRQSYEEAEAERALRLLQRERKRKD